MSKNSILLVIGETSQYGEAEKVRDVLESKLAVKFKVQELEDIASNISAEKFKSVASKVQAILLICSERVTAKIDDGDTISFDADGTIVTLEARAIPDVLDVEAIKNKFILISFESPAHIPHKLKDKDKADIFVFKKNIKGKELVEALKEVAVQVKSK